MLISMVSTKGGTGKTTSTMYLADVLSKQFPVTIVDMDPQGSATAWFETWEEELPELNYDLEIVNLQRLTKLKKGAEDKVVIVDTPPGNPQLLQHLIELSDFVVIPTLTTGVDIRRVWPTVEAMGDTPFKVLLTCVRRGTTLLREIKEVLQDGDIGTFGIDIPLRESVKSASLTYPPHDDAYEAYRQVAQEIMEAVK